MLIFEIKGYFFSLQKKMENMEITLKTVNKENDDILYKLKLIEKEKEEVGKKIKP